MKYHLKLFDEDGNELESIQMGTFETFDDPQQAFTFPLGTVVDGEDIINRMNDAVLFNERKPR